MIHDITQDVTPVQVSEATLTTHKQIDQIVEIAPAPVCASIPRGLLNPFPDITPTKWLEKEYKVASYTWNATIAPQILRLPGTFFDIPSLACALSTFKFWRGKFNVHVVMNATPYHQGAIMVSWLPCFANTGLTNGVYEASGNNSIILNISTSDSCKFTIPYVSPKAWLLNPPTNPYDHSVVFFHPLVGLSNPSTTNDFVKVDVYLSMSDISVAGYEMAQSGREFDSRSKSASSGTSSWIQPIVSTMDMIPDVISGVSSIASALACLDKVPERRGVFPVTVNPMRDLFTSVGVDPSTSLTFAPESLLANDHDLMGTLSTASPNNLLCAQPMLYLQRVFETGSMGELVIPVHPLFPATDGTSFFPDYLYHFASVSRYWRGTIKFMFHFCTNQFVKGKFKILLSFNSGALDFSSTGDLPATIVDVGGTTMSYVSVPYLHDTLWSLTEWSQGFLPRLHVIPIGDLQGASLPADAVITLSVFRAGGEDFEVAHLDRPLYYTPAPKKSVVPKGALHKEKGQCYLNGAFAKTFASFISGIVQSTEVGLCQTEVISAPDLLMKRYAMIFTTEVLDPFSLNFPTTTHHPYMYHYGRVFTFWRGSRRISIVPEAALGPGAFSLADKAGTAALYRAPWIETLLNGSVYPRIAMPYQSTLPYQFTSEYPGTVPDGYQLALAAVYEPSGTGRYYVAAGDDLVFGHLHAPAYQVASPEPPTS